LNERVRLSSKGLQEREIEDFLRKNHNQSSKNLRKKKIAG
jgi:hypothetical protein